MSLTEELVLDQMLLPDIIAYLLDKYREEDILSEIDIHQGNSNA